MNFLLVALGGALGATGRYAVGLLPVKSTFPLLTLIVNILGALLIGLVAGLSVRGGLSPRWTLFWKTGVCGGFTTFSAFSLETLGLFQSGNRLLGGAYILLSVSLCLLGVWLGQMLSTTLPPKA